MYYLIRNKLYKSFNTDSFSLIIFLILFLLIIENIGVILVVGLWIILGGLLLVLVLRPLNTSREYILNYKVYNHLY